MDTTLLIVDSSERALENQLMDSTELRLRCRSREESLQENVISQIEIRLALIGDRRMFWFYLAPHHKDSWCRAHHPPLHDELEAVLSETAPPS